MINGKTNFNWSDLGPTAINSIIPFSKDNLPKNDFKINIDGTPTFIINSIYNIFPVHWFHGPREYLNKPYNNYLNIVKPFQPLHILVNGVYRECENIINITDKPIYYFLKKGCINNNIDIDNYFENKNMKIYIYNNFNFYKKYREPYFEECTFIERYFFDELVNNDKYIKVQNLTNADIAFIPIIPASHIYELGIESFKNHYNKFIKYINLESNIPHFIIYPYTFYDKDYNNISFIDKRIYILGFENEITNFDYYQDILNSNPKVERAYNSITIPFHLKKNSHNVCKGIEDTLSPCINDFEKSKLFCYVGMFSDTDPSCIQYPNRKRRLINYRENILNEFVKKYGEDAFLIGRPDKNNAFDFYKQSKYALIFRGDCMTRAAFYQALMAGSVPIICNDCFLDYQNYNGFYYNLEDAVIRIPYYNELNNREKFNFLNENNLWNIIDKYINNDNLRLDKLKNIKKIVNYIDYNKYINNIRAPIYYSLKSIIKTNELQKNYKLVYFYFKNNELLKNISNDSDFKQNNIIDFNNDNYITLNYIFKDIYKTYNYDKSQYIIIPVFYLDINKFNLINIDKNKKYILIFDNIDDSYFSLIIKYPKKSIILYNNIIKNDIITLKNVRLKYYGKETEETINIGDKKIYYGETMDIRECENILQIEDNYRIKNIVYYKPNNLIYAFNNFNFELFDNKQHNEFNSYVKYNDYFNYINDFFHFNKIDKNNTLNYLINNYL